MKTNLKSNSILLGGLLLLGTVFSCTQAEQDYASYVNPFIGTGGHGHTYPGAVVPNGMIQPSPDTTHLRMGRLFRILLRGYYHQRFLAYPCQRNRMCGLR